ncbi:MAG TPA: multidrug efflux RND transporter permease subunit [Gemmatimonadales bacterium]|nr:multidrug efflux RND transporter permease subunit [Gemmatimonadales bacterium]
MSEFFIRRPIVAMVISIVTVLVGLVALQRLPIAQYPEITPPEVQVSATYTGADAVAVEQSVATPIEQKVNGVENMIYMRSINANDGTMSLRVSFDVGTNLDIANVLTQNRLSEATGSLPEDVKKFGVTVKKSLVFPLMVVSLVSPHGTFNSQFLTNYATINIVDQLSRIRGVGQVTLFGGSDYAMRVWVRPDRLSALKLMIPDLTSAVQQQNVITPAGQIGGPPAPPGQQFTYAVRTTGRLTSEQEFGNIIVRTNPDGSQIHLRDVARLELGTMNYSSIGRLDGAQAAVILIYQIPGTNALDVAAQITSTMAGLAKQFPTDMEHRISLDTTLPVSEGISEIVHTLFEAVVLVILVVFIFLQDWRATLIPLLTVPVSLVGALAVFPLLGFSINVLSLLGLVLAIGIVVDDAIVVVEAVMHHIEHGKTPKEATQQAMKEVSGPVVAIALVLTAVFVPVAAMGGITGRLYQQFAITIAISVLLSAFNALTLSPALSALLLRPADKEKKGALAKFFAWFNKVFGKLTDGYVGFTGILVRKMVRSLAFIGILVVGVVFLGWKLPAGFVPEEDQGYVMANVQLPDASSLERTDNVAKAAEKILMQTPGVASVTTITGYSLLTQAFASNQAFFFVALKPWHERHGETEHARGVVVSANTTFRQQLPQAIAFAFGPPAIPGLGTGAGFSMMLQDRAGRTPEYLSEQTASFIQAARARPEIGNIVTAYRATVPQVFADVNRDKVLTLGLRLADVNTSLGAFLGGQYINDFNRFGRLYKVYIQAEPEFRTDVGQLQFFNVRSNTGAMVPLSTLVDTRTTAGPEYTNRFNLYRSAEVTGIPAPGYSSAQALTALEEVAHQTLPPDMGYAWNAMSFQEKAAEGKGAVVFGMALVFVFLILAAQYESWSLPFSVLLGTPFAVFGAFFGLWVGRFLSQSYVNNVFAQIGLVMLIGLAAKNAILIVEFARAKAEEGSEIVAAAMEAAKLRLRPILMTAFAFILGVIPLVTASGAGAEARKVMGLAVFSGMLIATILGVCLVPVLFVMVEKLTGGGKKHAAAAPASSGHASGGGH